MADKVDNLNEGESVTAQRDGDTFTFENRAGTTLVHINDDSMVLHEDRPRSGRVQDAADHAR